MSRHFLRPVLATDVPKAPVGQQMPGSLARARASLSPRPGSGQVVIAKGAGSSPWQPDRLIRQLASEEPRHQPGQSRREDQIAGGFQLTSRPPPVIEKLTPLVLILPGQSIWNGAARAKKYQLLPANTVPRACQRPESTATAAPKPVAVSRCPVSSASSRAAARAADSPGSMAPPGGSQPSRDQAHAGDA